VPRPSVVSRSAALGVNAVLTRMSPTCLERALVLQRWQASVGDPRDVVIGLPPDGLHASPAHAWVDGLDDASPADYVELHRLPSPQK
jgi:hypothetical protein